MPDDDPVTGRQFLTRSAYADDRHLRSRTASYAYAETAADAMARWPLDFDAVFADIAMTVEQAIQANGSFRATTHMGVFICR